VKPRAGKLHAGFDVTEAGNVLIKHSGAPILDPTDEELEIGRSATTPAFYFTVDSICFFLYLCS